MPARWVMVESLDDYMRSAYRTTGPLVTARHRQRGWRGGAEPGDAYLVTACTASARRATLPLFIPAMLMRPLRVM